MTPLRSLPKAVLTAIFVFGLLLAALSPTAHAGTYPMYQCRTADGRPSVISSVWRIVPAPGGQFYNRCASDGDFGIVHTPAGNTGDDGMTWLILEVPASSANTSITSARLAMSIGPKVSDPTSGNGTVAIWSAGELIEVEPLPPGQTGWIDRLTRPLGGAFPSGARDLALTAWCWRNCRFTADSVSARIEQAVLTLAEDAPPTVDHIGGSIAEPGLHRGIESLAYDASDGDSGIRRVAVQAGDTVLAADDFQASCTYTDFHACPPQVHDRAVAIDSTRLDDGEHRLTLIVEDAAGNVRRVDGPKIAIRNSARSATAPIDKRLSAAFSVNGRRRLTVPFTSRVRVRGQLVDVGGAGVAGAEIQIAGRSTVPGSSTRNLGSATTSTRGTWKLILPAHLSSTRLTISAHGAESTALRLSVRAGVVLGTARRTVPPYGTIKFRGRLTGTPIPRRGKLVELRARGAVGGRWLTFRTVRTDPRGRFAISYRLQRGYRGVTYRFQAVSRYESAYPYATGRSRDVRVHVR
jgi:hypothetical protein